MSDNEIGTAVAGAEEVRPDTETLLSELAALSPAEYESRRKSEAKRLGWRSGVLDDEVRRRRPNTGDGQNDTFISLPSPEPWPEEVDGAELLDELVRNIRRFVILPDGGAETMALWVLHSHAHDAAYHSPLLALTSPEKRCGKTTALLILQRLVPKPLPTSNITSAALFRSIRKWQPTILVDEADTFLRDSDELRGVINSGHCRDSAFLIRTTGDDHEPEQFPTWAPKAIAMIGRLPDTMEDRSLTISMRRKAPGEQAEKFRPDRDTGLGPVASKCARWSGDNLDRLKAGDPVTPAKLHDRAADNWRPLFAIADAAGGHWPETARRTALTISGGGEDASIRVQLLEDIRTIFETRDVDRVSSAELCAALAEMEDRPWPEWGRTGKPITAPALSRQLGHFRIKPNTIRLGTGTIKGYTLEQFEDTFSRYLRFPPNLNVTPSQPLATAGYSDSLTVTQGGDVTVRNRPKPASSLTCDGVTVRNGGNPGNDEIGAVEGGADALDDPPLAGEVEWTA